MEEKEKEEKILFRKLVLESEIKMALFCFIIFILAILSLFYLIEFIPYERLQKICSFIILCIVVISGGCVWFSSSIIYDDFVIIKKIKNNTYIELKSKYTSNHRISIIENETIRISIGHEIQHLKISEIKIIGEITTTDGPYADDWFLVFIMNKETWFQILMYAENMQDVLKELSIILDAEIVESLFYSTSWKTNVIYPNECKGKELFLEDENFMNKKLILNQELENLLL